MPGKRLTIVLGPTAVGKSEYAIELARQAGSPVVNCDSRQIYKELTIGTAVPSAGQLEAVKHYFIQTHSITEHYTAGRFEIEALALLKELFATHDNIIMCGGSGLYIDALCNGLDNFPPPDLQLRSHLTRRLEKEGIESLRMELRNLDRASYEALDIANPQRIVRALEVTLQTGRKFSEWKTGIIAGNVGRKRGFDVVKIGLRRERALLYKRINERVEQMMSAGLLEEVKSLDHFRYLNGTLHADLLHIPALRTVGYRELFDYIDGKCKLGEAVELIKRNTRRYAKRQMTWWGRDAQIQWVDLV